MEQGTWNSLIYSWELKVVIPLLVPIATTAIKQVVDKWTPIVLNNVPKPLWALVAVILGGLPPLLSPEMFVLPGFPSVVSVALYGLAAMGVRELVDQGIKVVGPPPTQPTGI